MCEEEEGKKGRQRGRSANVTRIRGRETAINKLKHERGVMESVLTQIYPVG